MPKISVRVIDAYVYCNTDEGLRFLLLKRASSKIYEHLWQGVAGKIENGETAWEAAVRELKEETGFRPLRMFVADHVSTFYETHGDRVNLVPVFGIEVDKKTVILSEEHSDYKWTDFDTAYKTLVWSGQKKGITVVYKMLNSNDERVKWSNVSL